MADLLSVVEAQAIIQQHAEPLPAEERQLADLPLGQVLAEDIYSDLDSPPFDKALMDGYAVRTADVGDGRAPLAIVEEVTAGRTPTLPLGPGEATRIMTGAPLPAGADAVVPVERTRLVGGRVSVSVEERPLFPGANIMRRGQEMRCGDRVLDAGTVLRPVEFGVLAGVGRNAVKAIRSPRVAVLSTGDEIVEAPTLPGPGQIRNSNGPMLTALVSHAGGRPRYLGNASDRLDSLQPLVVEGLEQCDALVLCGGVSAGKLDLVPDVLRAAGVIAHFHKVAMKPGKPFLFGSRGKTLVFGLPGNPVSSLVCFELFMRPALHRLRGFADPGPHFVRAPVTEDFVHKSDRPTYHPARLESAALGWHVRRARWLGSPDLNSLTRANALVLLPAGEHAYHAGQVLEVLPLKSEI